MPTGACQHPAHHLHPHGQQSVQGTGSGAGGLGSATLKHTGGLGEAPR